MTSKHTAGPWLLCGKDSLELSAYLPGKSEKDIEATQSYYVPLIKMAYGDWQGKDWLISKEEYQANARLIAASPLIYDYIEGQANNGDEKAQKIIDKINT